jgi:hypothetical protein
MFIPTKSTPSSDGQLRTLTLNHQEDSKKTQMSANKPGKLATDNRARKQEWLHVVAVAAEGVESDRSCVSHC